MIHRSGRPRILAFTLLEVLLVVVMLGALAVAAFSWAEIVRARTHDAETRLRRQVALLAVLRLLQEDCLLIPWSLGSSPMRILGRDTLDLMTSDHPPGDPVGFHHVRWTIDHAKQRVQRQVLPNGPIRTVSEDVGDIAFIEDPTDGPVIEMARPIGQDRVRFPLLDWRRP